MLSLVQRVLLGSSEPQGNGEAKRRMARRSKVLSRGNVRSHGADAPTTDTKSNEGELLMKKNGSLVAAMLGAALLAGSATSAFAVATCGDINNSGLPVNAVDCNAIATVILNSGTPVGSHCDGAGTLDCGDIVEDGVINTQDLVACLQMSVGIDTLLTPCTGFGPTLACNTNVQGTITTNQVWPTGCDTFVDGTVVVTNGAVVTVQAGATVKGKKNSFDTSTSVLVITRDSKINAAGNAAQPIVMTSDQTPGTRAVQDWGGLVLLGRAPTNFPGGEGNAEGLDPGTAVFGGNEPNDSSGVVRFTRIEFSGAPFGVDNELNTFTMNGIGRGTTIDHVQANRGFDDCIEWFGGTVRAKYLVSSGCQDDLFDWQIAFRGAVQFGLAVQDPGAGGDSGFEADNNEFGENNLPRSNPTFCNMTMIGDRQYGSTDGGAGIRLRRGTAGSIGNTIVTGWQTAGIRVDDNNTMQNACTNSTTLGTATADLLRVQDTYIYNSGSGGTTQMRAAALSPCTATELYNLWNATEGVEPASGATGVDPLPSLTGVYPTVVDARFFPADEGVADNAPDCKLLLPDFFDSAAYEGAFDPNNNPGGNWLSTAGGWISFAAN